VSELALQMAIATVLGPLAALRLARLCVRWQVGLSGYTAGVVASHVGPLALTFSGGVVLTAASIVLCAGLRDVPPAGWFLYLFAAMPPMDLVAAWYLSTGRGDLGVVMVIGSLPVGAASFAAAWRWLLEEESRAT
jgi:hypothetical protein